ncbi:MAG: hypothetical protein ABW003_22150 [Microvirga sp.]
MQTEPHPPGEGRAKRLLWFVFIYVASLIAFAVLVYGLRWTIPH